MNLSSAHIYMFFFLGAQCVFGLLIPRQCFQVNFILIEIFPGLDPQVLKFTNHFCLVVNRFD